MERKVNQAETEAQKTNAPEVFGLRYLEELEHEESEVRGCSWVSGCWDES